MIIDIIKNLKQVRRFSNRTISNDDLTHITDAGRFSQALVSMDPPCTIGIVNDKGLIAQLSKCSSQGFIETAPVIIVICTPRMTEGDTEVERFRLGKLKDDIYDIDPNVLDILCAKEHQALIAAQNMALAACELGIDSCIVANLDVYKASKVLRVPNSHLVTYLMTIGYEDGEHQNVERNTVEDMVFYNQYDK